MSVIFDNDILIHYIAAPGLPGDGLTAPEAATLRADLDTLLSRPLITELDAIPDVDASSPADGQSLIYDEATDTWKPGATGGTISLVKQSGSGGESATDVSEIIALPGITVIAPPSEPGRAYLNLAFGGTGTATTVSRRDHTHTTAYIARPIFAPSGYMSGSSRTLVSTNVTLAAGITYLVEAVLLMQVRGGDTGPCYYTQTVSINGSARTSPDGVNGKWAVQGVPRDSTWKSAETVTGTGGTIPVTASIAYHSGGGIYPDFGELEIKLTPNR